MNRKRHRVKLVNNFEARFLAQIIDAGNIDQIIERHLVSTEFRHHTQIFRLNSERSLMPKFDSALNFLAEQTAQRFQPLGPGHLMLLWMPGAVATPRMLARMGGRFWISG